MRLLTRHLFKTFRPTLNAKLFLQSMQSRVFSSPALFIQFACFLSRVLIDGIHKLSERFGSDTEMTCYLIKNAMRKMHFDNFGLDGSRHRRKRIRCELKN
jgi:hypothetical protein